MSSSFSYFPVLDKSRTILGFSAQSLNQDLPNLGFPPQNASPPAVLFQKSIKMEADKDTDVSLKAGGDILEVTPKM